MISGPARRGRPPPIGEVDIRDRGRTLYPRVVARPSPKRPAPARSKGRPAPEPPPEPEEQAPVEEAEPTPEEQRAIDQGTLRFFGVLLAIGELVALVWAVRTHPPRWEYLAVAGAIAVLFGTPMVFAWRSLSQPDPDQTS